MEIVGKVICCLPKKTGKSASGEWQKKDYVLETEGQYPKKICFMVWGDKIDQFAIVEGELLSVSIDLESKEYNGRWYTDVKAWRISRDLGAQGGVTSVHQADELDGPFGSLDGDTIPF